MKIKLCDAGNRERNAFNLWVGDNVEIARRIGVGVHPSPFLSAQAEATYDANEDSITWRGVVRTIGEIVNGMPGEIAAHESDTRTPAERARAEVAQERELFGASATLDRQPSATHRLLLEQEIRRVVGKAEQYVDRIDRGMADNEDRDALDFYQRLGLALIRMRGLML